VLRERIVYSYEMRIDGPEISVSLATLEIEPAGEGRTKLKVWEQGAFLDGYDDAGKRKHGTGRLVTRSDGWQGKMTISLPRPAICGMVFQKLPIPASIRGGATASSVWSRGRLANSALSH
jgi:hypothetical protein